jgi:hypothetical protein
MRITCLQTDRAPSGVLHRLGTVWASHSVALGWTREAGSRQLKHKSVGQRESGSVGLRRRVKPRLLWVCYGSYAALLIAIPIAMFAAYSLVSQVAPQLLSEDLSPAGAAVLIGGSAIYAGAVIAGVLLGLRSLFTRFRLLTPAEARDFLPAYSRFPDSWLDDV